MKNFSKVLSIIKNMENLSSLSKETVEEALIKLVEETGELASCILKENNKEHMTEEACDIIQASFKLAYIIQKQCPEVDFLDKLLEKNEKWRKSYPTTR